MSGYDKLWQLTVKEKRELYGKKHIIAVGSKTVDGMQECSSDGEMDEESDDEGDDSKVKADDFELFRSVELSHLLGDYRKRYTLPCS